MKNRLRIAEWAIGHIAEAVHGEVVGEAAERVDFVSTDTREIQSGALFVPIVGERFDGHDFVTAAVESGAKCVLTDRRFDLKVPQIVVDDTTRAFQRLGRAIFDEAVNAGMTPISLTGSNGKTTTKEITAALWSSRRSVQATRGNLNNHIGLPITLCELECGTEIGIFEMGTNQPGDILELSSMAPARIRLITSIGAAHLERLIDLDGVRREKSQILVPQADESTVAVVPVSEASALVPSEWPGRVIRVGPGGDCRVVKTTPQGQGQRVVVDVGTRLELALPLPGSHNALNLALAIATLAAADPDALNDQHELQRALDRLVLPGGRMDFSRVGRYTFIDDAYNANPTSVRASFEAFGEIGFDDHDVEGLSRVAVVGEMLELGSHAAQMHVELARDLAQSNLVETLVFVGSWADDMADAARRAGADARAFEDADAAGAWLVERGPCMVWLKASRGARLERIVEPVTRHESRR